MHIHHLNCVSTCPLGGLLMDGRSRSLRGRLVCHCLLVETDTGLLLIDSGLGMSDVIDARTRLSPLFRALVAPELREDMTAVRQIAALGFDARDVRDIVLTHLDFDHAGGLDDFPHARVHLLASERDAALAQRTWLDRQRYRPQQWSTRDRWQVYTAGEGAPWFEFSCVRDMNGVADDILLVPLIGHTLGHAGVAVRGDRGWILLAGDAYFYHAEMELDRPRCTPGLRFYQWMMEKDRGARLWNQRRLRALRSGHDEVTLFCSHDVREFERLAGRASDRPAAAHTARPARGVPRNGREHPEPTDRPHSR